MFYIKYVSMPPSKKKKSMLACESLYLYRLIVQGDSVYKYI